MRGGRCRKAGGGEARRCNCLCQGCDSRRALWLCILWCAQRARCEALLVTEAQEGRLPGYQLKKKAAVEGGTTLRADSWVVDAQWYLSTSDAQNRKSYKALDRIVQIPVGALIQEHRLAWVRVAALRTGERSPTVGSTVRHAINKSTCSNS